MFGLIAKRFLTRAVIAPMFIVLAAGGAASAQTLTSEGPPPSDPLLQWADQLAPRNTFYLNSTEDVELVRFKSPHYIELCAARPNPNEIGAARRGYPIKVKWDQDVGVIVPGNCLSFEAQRVTIRSATDLPPNVELTGTVKVIR